MGTRHLIVIWFNGQYVLAQYGQWDGDPGGQGIIILKFLTEYPDNLPKLKANLHLVRQLDGKEAMGYLDECAKVDRERQRAGIEYDPEYISTIYQRYASLSRETSAGILRIIADANGENEIMVLPFGLEYCLDPSCEWVYVLDLDTNHFEVYEGRKGYTQNGPHRFASLMPPAPNERRRRDPLRLPCPVADFSLDKLPTKQEFFGLMQGARGLT